MRTICRLAARFAGAFVFVVVVLLGALAMVDNQGRVALHFLEWQTMELSIYWWLFSALLVGFLLGWMLTALSALRRRAGARQDRR